MKAIINLENKTILVAGAAGLIGKGIVQGALDSGANVVALDRGESTIVELRKIYQDKSRFFSVNADITNTQELQAAFDAAVKRFGSIDGAANSVYPRNANYGRKFFEVTYTDFCENTSIHLGAYFHFMQQCAKYVQENTAKFSLINLASIYGVMAPRFEVYDDTPMTMPVEYAAIKSGLIHMTRYVNSYMKGSGFRANCVSPGGVLSDQNPNFLARYNAHCMTKGMLDSTDIVGTILYLLSDASQYVAGQNIMVDDGFSL